MTKQQSLARRRAIENIVTYSIDLYGRKWLHAVKLASIIAYGEDWKQLNTNQLDRLAEAMLARRDQRYYARFWAVYGEVSL